MNAGKESEILKIIEKLTTSGQKTLDEDLMTKLKGICKSSKEHVKHVYYVLMTQLRKEHSEIRYSALLIINEFFCKSSAFRKLLETDLDELFELVIETNLDKPLPLPQQRAKELKIKGLEFVKEWTTKFGNTHIRLQYGLRYLQNCKKIDFNDMEARSIAQRERERQERERLERILNGKINTIKTEIREISEEISFTLLQMENCFKLLIPHHTEELFSSEDFEKSGEKDEMSVQDGPSSLNSLRQHGIYDVKKTITIEVSDCSEVSVKANQDNLPILENLNDLQKQISSRYFPMVTKWLKILTKGSNCTDTLKRAIDLKNLMESALEKYRDLKIKPDTKLEDDDDDDDFIEVKEKDGFEATAIQEPIKNVSSQESCSKNLSSVEKARMWKLKHSKDDVKDPTSAASTLSKRIAQSTPEIPLTSAVSTEAKHEKEEEKSHKVKLLEKAPVLPYDIDLYHWEEEKPLVPEVVKFDSLHKFWETKDDDNPENEALKKEQIASLRTRKIDFSGKFEPVKWSCRAPLPNGKLCPRMDRYKCPFHGKIIKRDAVGKPVDDKDVAGPSNAKASTSAVPEWQDPELLRDIEAATGVDLKVPQKGKRTVKKEGGLTNIKKIKTSAQDRLSKKIMKRYPHYAKKLDDLDRKRFNDKFGDQWNYY